MKKFLSVTIILAMLMALCSCAPSAQTELLCSPFRCEISWLFDGRESRANIVCSQASDNALSMTLTYPPELVGISLESRFGALSLYVDGVELDLVPYTYSHLAALLLCSAPFKFVSVTDLYGKEALCYSRGPTNWYFSSSDGSPIGFDDGSVFFEIIWIEGA